MADEQQGEGGMADEEQEPELELESLADEEPPEAPEPEPEAEPTTPAPEGEKKGIRWLLALTIAVPVVALASIPVVYQSTKAVAENPWTSDHMIATYILVGLVIGVEACILILMKTARTRYSVEKHILDHGDVHEYVILWNRPRWILYTPTMFVSLLFGLVLAVQSLESVPDFISPGMLGGIWVVLCFVNVLVEQFHMSIKVVFIIVPTLGALLLVLRLVNYADEVIRLLRFAAVDVEPKLYFMAAFTIAFIIFVGWVHGLFHYMAITPNVADLQRGLTETGRQVKNADYDVDFDATDVVERWLFGFGRIIISFRDPSRPPMVFFVPRASVVDELVRRVRSVTAIDRTPQHPAP